MSTFTYRARFLGYGISAGLVCVALTAEVAAQNDPAWPDFSSNRTGWVGMGGEFLPIPGDTGPKPMTFDPKYPYVPNNTGAQPTFRIADLTNPNLKPWVKERMKTESCTG